MTVEGLTINSLKKKDLLTLGFMMFSIYFGAGNLIFPPALGQAAGDHTLHAMLGFMTTGIGLPLLGITAIALAGGEYVPLLHVKDVAALCDGAARHPLPHHRAALCHAAHRCRLV